jgi:cell division control protein 6
MEIFKNKEVLDIEYIPTEDMLLLRKNEQEQLRRVFKNISSVPNHLACYGFTGTGKTCLTKFLMKRYIHQKFNQRILYINTCSYPTEHQALFYIVSLLGFNVKGTNLPSHYNALKKVINDYDLHILIVLDEVDKLLNKSGDNLLYNLLDTGRISLIMITNNVTCFDKIEDRVKSRLGGMPRILFSPYNAIQIGEILQKRVGVGFNESVFEDMVVPKIAAIAAQEHGDIRKAINLLRATGEIAEEKGTKIREGYIDMAYNLTESNEISNLITSLPLQARYVLMALCSSIRKLHAVDVAASTIYEEYLNVVKSYGVKELTDRRIADYVWTLDNTSLTIPRISSKRYGKERVVRLGVPINIITRILQTLENG